MKYIYIALCALLITHYTYACQCIEIFPTCCESLYYIPEVIELHGNPILATCVKLDNYYHGAHFKVLEVLGGELEKDTILMWGTNGIDCRISVWQFAIGDTIIFLTYPFLNDPFGQTLEQAGDFAASICRVSNLPVRNDTVFGPVDVGVYNLPYQAFKDYIAGCYPYTDVSSTPVYSLNIRLMQPNYQIPISLPIKQYPMPTKLYFDVFDLNGCPISRQALPISSNMTVDVPTLKGLFIYQLSTEQQILTSGKMFL